MYQFTCVAFVLFCRPEMLEYSDERHPWESVGEKLTLIRDVMRKAVGKVPEKTE